MRSQGLMGVMPCPTTPPEFKKSFENDSQSSDNINFLKVQWSSRQLPTVRRGRGQEGLVLGGGCWQGDPPVPSSCPLAHS